jgi:hypothetical protein
LRCSWKAAPGLSLCKMGSDFEDDDTTSLYGDEYENVDQPSQIVPSGEKFLEGEIDQAQLGLVYSVFFHMKSR